MMGDPVGLDYAGLAVVAGAMEIDLDHEMMRMIRVLEAAAISGPEVKSDSAGKPCRTAAACAMCAKHCPERIGA